ncbi:hypothetical protein C8F01DRAFT_1360718 [Mycena amicta]|nr:hypothetical protein C8F01DRAFT_1360718 [Mycena amicta]
MPPKLILSTIVASPATLRKFQPRRITRGRPGRPQWSRRQTAPSVPGRVYGDMVVLLYMESNLDTRRVGPPHGPDSASMNVNDGSDYESTSSVSGLIIGLIFGNLVLLGRLEPDLDPPPRPATSRLRVNRHLQHRHASQSIIRTSISVAEAAPALSISFLLYPARYATSYLPASRLETPIPQASVTSYPTSIRSDLIDIEPEIQLTEHVKMDRDSRTSCKSVDCRKRSPTLHKSRWPRSPCLAIRLKRAQCSYLYPMNDERAPTRPHLRPASLASHPVFPRTFSHRLAGLLTLILHLLCSLHAKMAPLSLLNGTTSLRSFGHAHARPDFLDDSNTRLTRSGRRTHNDTRTDHSRFRTCIHVPIRIRITSAYAPTRSPSCIRRSPSCIRVYRTV